MRFMMLMIPKGYEKAGPGAMPDAERVAAMMRYNESLAKGRRATRTRWSAPAVNGGARLFCRRQAQRYGWAFYRSERGSRRLLDDSGQVERRGDRMEFALLRFGQ